MREINTNAYVSALRGIVEEGKDVNLLVAGSSMAPFLVHHRDMILFGKPERDLHRGDMVFYQRLNGQFVMHRIYRVRENGYDIVGDGQTEIERNVSDQQIFAIVKKVRRKGVWVGPEDKWWWFFEKVWIRLVPLRPLIKRIYGIVKWER